MPDARAARIDLASARTIVDRAIGHARSNDFPPMTVAVFDTTARLVAFAGEDGSSLLRERIARGKAHGALNMGVGSRSLAARAASNPAFVNSLVSLAEGNLVPVPGGVLIRADNEPARQQIVEQRHLLGDPHRIDMRDDRAEHRDLDARRVRRQMRRDNGRGGRHAAVRIMVLGDARASSGGVESSRIHKGWWICDSVPLDVGGLRCRSRIRRICVNG